MFSFAAIMLNLLYPVSEAGFSIVVPGNYFQGEVELESGESWQGLFQMDTFFELRTVELHVEEAQSLVDRGKEKTGKDVFVSEEKGNLLFLVRSDESHFADGPVEPILFYTDKIAADTSIVLEGSWIIYTDQEGLFLTDGEISQRLSNVYPNAYGEGVSVVWAGDLDGDGMIDIVLNDEPHYAYKYYYRLFLSSEAEDDLLVKEVAEFVAVSC